VLEVLGLPGHTVRAARTVRRRLLAIFGLLAVVPAVGVAFPVAQALKRAVDRARPILTGRSRRRTHGTQVRDPALASIHRSGR